ncbi:DUF3558 domain-containing protein [Pseudonocardia alaniniphila]|uniref:DUF3558 domain-containing protein n=1 Tax=Pseudonocardia alaniniphila TaxID=75291 RepID=UPI0024027E3B|nr:DUF3558 domain-containing protein [Pseudonocardia alaniniphila]
MLVGGCSDGGGPVAPVEPSGIQLPPRPRDVRIDGVDPCSLLTEEQRADLGLDGRPVFDSALSELYPGDVPACAIRGFDPRAVLAGVSVVTTAGVELFTSRELALKLEPVVVHGFPGLVAVPTGFTEWCGVIVDVAPGQLLDIHFADGGRQPPIPQLQLCKDAQAVADAVVTTLLASR